MLEKIIKRKYYLEHHHLNAPLLAEREAYLTAMYNRGLSHGMLLSTADYLLRIIEFLDLRDDTPLRKVSIGEIENIEARESVFGKKVTLSKADYDRLSDTAKKYVAMEKNISKLRKERDTAVQELETMKKQFDALSSEYSDYRKDRESIRTKIKSLNREEQLTNELKKSRDFITARGLSDDFERFRLEKTKRIELE